MKHIFAALLSAFSLQATNADEHWNQFRGPQGNGISTAVNLPVEFNEVQNVRWKTAIPDEGWSSSVVWGNEIWLTAGSDEKKDREVVTDWDATLRSQGFSPKEGGKPNDNKKSFATATLIAVGGQRQLIAPAAEATIAYDPETGDELWRTLHPGGFNVAARPIYAHGMVYVFTSGLTSYLMGINTDGIGDVTNTHVAWSTTRSTPKIPSPVIVDDLLFMVTDESGIVRCLDAKTGREIWKARIGGNHWASPLYAAGKLYFCGKDGVVAVLDASAEVPANVVRNRMNASFIASPAVAGEALILRSTTHLYCLARGFNRSDEQVAADVYPGP